MSDDIAPEMRAFADDIGRLLAGEHGHLSIREEPPERPGGEPGVTLLVDGAAVFWFARDEFLEAMYVAGCDVLADLQRKGLPLAVGAQRTGPVQ